MKKLAATGQTSSSPRMGEITQITVPVSTADAQRLALAGISSVLGLSDEARGLGLLVSAPGIINFNVGMPARRPTGRAHLLVQ